MPAGPNTHSDVGIRRMIRTISPAQYRCFEPNGQQTYTVQASSYSHAGNAYAKGATIPFDGGGAPPSSVGAVLAAGGGLIVGTAYHYVVTAIIGGIETAQSSEVSATPTSGSQTINVTWSAEAGATGYRVYRTTTSGSYVSPALVGSAAASPFSDTGGALSVGSPPAASVTGYTNSARMERDFNRGVLDPSS